MMQKPTRNSIFEEASRLMRVQFEEVRSSVPHKGRAGGEGERIINNFLNDHLPARFRASSGFVIDKKDVLTGHMDSIIYDAHNCPIYRTSKDDLIIPSDNAASVFEVKFDLTNTLLKSALAKVNEAKNLAKTPDQDRRDKFETTKTFGVIFAFESNLKVEKIISTWAESLQRNNDISNTTSMIVVLDRGIVVPCVSLPGEKISPIQLEGLPLVTPIGTQLGLGFLDYKKNTLDGMMRILLSHLTFFRHRVDHPGFDFSTLEKNPIKWIIERDAVGFKRLE